MCSTIILYFLFAWLMLTVVGDSCLKAENMTLPLPIKLTSVVPCNFKQQACHAQQTTPNKYTFYCDYFVQKSTAKYMLPKKCNSSTNPVECFKNLNWMRGIGNLCCCQTNMCTADPMFIKQLEDLDRPTTIARIRGNCLACTPTQPILQTTLNLFVDCG